MGRGMRALLFTLLGFSLSGAVARAGTIQACLPLKQLFVSAQGKLVELEPVDDFLRRRKVLSQQEINRRFARIEDKPAGVSQAAEGDPTGIEYSRAWLRDSKITGREITDPEVRKAFYERDFEWRTEAGRSVNDQAQAVFTKEGKAVTWVPQKDGPGYRLQRVREEVERLLKEGKRDEARRLYHPLHRKVNSAKWDAEYLAHHVLEDSVELWEEEGGLHLHTLLIDHAGLQDAYWMASQLELKGAESAAVMKYGKAMREIENFIKKNAWDAKGGYLKSTIRQNPAMGFVHKLEPLDTAAILGPLHASDTVPASKMVIKFTDDQLMATVTRLEEEFSKNYQINHLQEVLDPANRGAAYMGRYTHDVFHGGNPWVLTTYATGTYYYKFASELASKTGARITPTNQRFYARLLGVSPDSAKVAVGREVTGALKNEILLAAKEKGDAFVKLVQRVTPPDGILHEQIARGFVEGDRQWPWGDKYLHQMDGIREEQITEGWAPFGIKSKKEAIAKGGMPIGARNLLWNNEAELRLIRARDALIADLQKLGLKK